MAMISFLVLLRRITTKDEMDDVHKDMKGISTSVGEVVKAARGGDSETKKKEEE